jgi:response regulator RpfG family c-di-GMP phosphodiesterase
VIKVLVVDDDPQVIEIFRMYFEYNFEVMMLEAHSANGAMKVLDQVSDIDLIICDYRLNDQNGDWIYQKLLDQQSKTKFILLSESHYRDFPVFRERPPFGQLTKPNFLADLPELLSTLVERRTEPEYIRLHLKTMHEQGQVRCDLYTKAIEGRWVKVMKAGDLFEDADLLRFQEKGLMYLFAKTKEIGPWIENLIQHTKTKNIQRVEKARDALPWSQASLEMITEINREMGVSLEVQDLTYELISETLKNFEKNTSITELANTYQTDPHRYLSSHSLSIAYLACAFCTQVHGFQQPLLTQLILSALLHDLPLETDSLAKINSEAELKKARPPFTDAEKDRWRAHPNAAAALVDFFPNAKGNVQDILLRHHELPEENQNRRPESNRNASFALAEVFQITNQLAHLRDDPKFSKMSLLELIQELDDSYLNIEPYRSLIRSISVSLTKD